MAEEIVTEFKPHKHRTLILVFLIRESNTHTGYSPPSSPNFHHHICRLPATGKCQNEKFQALISRNSKNPRMNNSNQASVNKGQPAPTGPSSPDLVTEMKNIREEVVKLGVESANNTENTSFFMSTLESMLRRLDRIEHRMGIQENYPNRVNGLSSDSVLPQSFGTYPMNINSVENYLNQIPAMVNPFECSYGIPDLPLHPLSFNDYVQSVMQGHPSFYPVYVSNPMETEESPFQNKQP